MGATESSDRYPEPPQEEQSQLFVVRNGHYESQSLMPMAPQSGMLDFEGFIMRRGTSGPTRAPPPDMRQAPLTQSPVSVRRDSVRMLPWSDAVGAQPEAASASSSAHFYRMSTPQDQAQGKKTCQDETKLSCSVDDTGVLSFVFDSQMHGTLSLLLLTREVAIREDVATNADPCKDTIPNKRSSMGRMELRPREAVNAMAHALVGKTAMAHDVRRFGPGLGQRYTSIPIDLHRLPADAFTVDASRPKDVPIAVKLEADSAHGEEHAPTVHYSYVSLHKEAAATSSNSEALRPRWSAQVYAQKLQYLGQGFVLHEMFGISSKLPATPEIDGGNSDCVICLSEPRDTAVLPCRHMCFCSHCAGIVRLQCDKCPVCRQKVASLLQFKRNGCVDPLLEELMHGRKTADQAAAC